VHGKKPTTKIASEVTSIGWKLTSQDGLWVLQVRDDRVSLSYVRSNEKPYPGWEVFWKKVQAVWATAKDSLLVTSISRVGLRYINQLGTPRIAKALSSNSSDGKPFLATSHNVATDLAAEMISTMARSVLQFDNHHFATVHQLWQNQDSSEAELILDIDAYYVGETDVIEPTLERLREIKNSIFFESFSPELIEGFQHE
ncbi:MAG: TIGR04255 family protein, partial [Planctomycetota bacterium]